METPPAIPPAKPPLGRQFYITLLTPLVLVAVALALANTVTDFAMPLLLVGGMSMIVCSVLIAIQLSRRMGRPDRPAVGLGILLFFAMIAFYGVCFFVGCTAAVMMS